MLRHIFNTQLPVGACNRRLEAAAERDVPIIANMRFSYGILARIDDNGFRLRVRHAFIHNGISPRLRARYRPTASATLLELRYRINPLWTIWYLCVAAFAGWMVVVNATELLRRRGTGSWFLVLAPLVFLGFVILCILLARRDRHTLTRFIELTLDATPVDAESGLTSRSSGPAPPAADRLPR
jgi:hypothetical protein